MQATDNVDFYNILAPHHATTSRRMQQNVRDGLVNNDLGEKSFYFYYCLRWFPQISTKLEFQQILIK